MANTGPFLAVLRLGLPPHLIWRHPFPGPGLGVRLLCHPGGDAVAGIDLAERATQISNIEKLAGEGVNVTIPFLKSVGVQGDARTYRNFAILGGAYTREWPDIDALATKIINSQGLVNRVTISLCNNESGSTQPAYAVPKGKSTCTKDRFDLLRVADNIVTEELRRNDLIRSIWQCPVAMAPLGDESGTKETIILRPVTSTEAMTAEFSKVPWKVLDVIQKRILAETEGRILDVLYDVTNKPPGTIEWE